MSGKDVWAGEWVRVQPWLNKRFHTNGLCSICIGTSMAPGWLSIKTREFRCARCFDAEELHDYLFGYREEAETALHNDGITPYGRKWQAWRAQ
jgi:hypothetical protein